jgi:hypothetical protein
MELFGIIPAFFNMFNLGTRMELKWYFLKHFQEDKRV